MCAASYDSHPVFQGIRDEMPDTTGNFHGHGAAVIAVAQQFQLLVTAILQIRQAGSDASCGVQ
jgi:hypothetical protein